MERTKKWYPPPDLKIGSIWSFPQYTSTSVNEIQSFYFAKERGVQFKILAPKGTEIIPVMDDGAYAKQQEMVLKYGKRYIIEDVKNSKNGNFSTEITIRLLP